MGKGFGIKITKNIVYSIFNPGEKCWGPLIIKDYNDKEFWASPRSCALNYGVGIIEGLKAFRHKTGEIFLFRPDENAKRFNRSLEMIYVPIFPEEKFLEAVNLLVKSNSGFVPEHRNGTLYIRPVMYGNDQLGYSLDPEISYTAAFWCSPVGKYYGDDFGAMSLWLENEIVRAVPRGTGSIKASANYLLSRIANAKAKKNSCQETIFLDAKDRKYVEETGGTNIFLVKDGILSTPSLEQSTILAGITRKSIIFLAKEELGLEIQERNIAKEELFFADEVFLCGTAAVITPVGSIKDENGFHFIFDGQAGKITKTLYNTLTGIQCGDIEDKYRWLLRID
ncbi:MAG: branched-chain amino acid aminotransferase [Candidatus Nealsonbacteria bacterium]|nr:branched-chain amino acid aminotransferase [Candidatus Nealsonbacteria bacterium]